MLSKGCTSKLVQAPDDEDMEGMSAARIAATQAARRQPRQLRSASLSYLQQSVRETKPTVAKINKYLGDSKKSATARYLQLKSGHAVTGVHLIRMKKVQDTRCWWCGSRQQNVNHLMSKCRKWRIERASMLSKLASKKTKISALKSVLKLLQVFGYSPVLLQGGDFFRRKTIDDSVQGTTYRMPIVALSDLRSERAGVRLEHLQGDVNNRAHRILLAGEGDVRDLVFDCFDDCCDVGCRVEGIVVFFAARAAAVFVVDLAYSLGVTVEVDVLVWFGSGLGCAHGW
jgi:hypothetical protein